MATKILVSPRFPAAMLDIARSFVPAGFEMVVADAGTAEGCAALVCRGTEAAAVAIAIAQVTKEFVALA